MFESFFNRPKTPEEIDLIIYKVIDRKLSENGINSTGMYLAFKGAQEENTKRGFGLTNNYLLNLVRDTAIALSSSVEDVMYGGVDRTLANINTEIDKLRSELTDGEKRS